MSLSKDYFTLIMIAKDQYMLEAVAIAWVAYNAYTLFI